jgi:hypothetical protein
LLRSVNPLLQLYGTTRYGEETFHVEQNVARFESKQCATGYGVPDTLQVVLIHGAMGAT